MRFSGQGMMSHTASTTISRYFTKTRGRALSISWFGLSSAEFIMPVLMVYLLTIIDWQNLWLIFSISVLIILPIASFLLIKNLYNKEPTTIQNPNKGTNINRSAKVAPIKKKILLVITKVIAKNKIENEIMFFFVSYGAFGPRGCRYDESTPRYGHGPGIR